MAASWAPGRCKDFAGIMGFRVWGLGLGVQGLEFRVCGLGLTVLGPKTL